MGVIKEIAYKTKKFAPMETKQTVLVHSITVQYPGIEGDWRGTLANRQITIVQEEAWNEACKDVNNAELSWLTRRANLLIKDLPQRLTAETVGSRLKIGSEVILEITGFTAPCKRMEAAQPGLQEALKKDWRAGVVTKVVNGGTINIGDSVLYIKRDHAPPIISTETWHLVGTIVVGVLFAYSLS